jgi:hypothetical protein
MGIGLPRLDWKTIKRAACGVLFCALLQMPATHSQGAAFSVLTTTPITYNNLAAVVGPVIMNATTGAMSGSGYLASISVARGTIVINRATPTSVIVTGILAPPTISCGGVSVLVTGYTYDDSGCAVVASGLCTIYVALSLNVTASLQAGTCTAVPLDITVA